MFNSRNRIAGLLAAGSIAAMAAGTPPAAASVGPQQLLTSESRRPASTCTTYLAGGGSAAPGQPPLKVYAHARATCDYVFGVKMWMTLYRNGKKVGEKKVCQDGPSDPTSPVGAPKDRTCEVNIRVNNPSGTQTWKMQVTTQWINGSFGRVTKPYTKTFKL
ncbi:hypothetical protein ABZ897_28820 [Nonomuraea sp. NPDC046802]|uniref:hypothetical protein n=1 Tax=Nonomuraea sp. NPDC046802 TaxID=3154919 RepID=UPI0033D1AB1F